MARWSCGSARGSGRSAAVLRAGAAARFGAAARGGTTHRHLRPLGPLRYWPARPARRPVGLAERVPRHVELGPVADTARRLALLHRRGLAAGSLRGTACGGHLLGHASRPFVLKGCQPSGCGSCSDGSSGTLACRFGGGSCRTPVVACTGSLGAKWSAGFFAVSTFGGATLGTGGWTCGATGGGGWEACGACAAAFAAGGVSGGWLLATAGLVLPAGGRVHAPFPARVVRVTILGGDEVQRRGARVLGEGERAGLVAAVPAPSGRPGSGTRRGHVAAGSGSGRSSLALPGCGLLAADRDRRVLLLDRRLDLGLLVRVSRSAPPSPARYAPGRGCRSGRCPSRRGQRRPCRGGRTSPWEGTAAWPQ